MSVCQLIHDRFNALTTFSCGYDATALPKNGIYIVFEKGEFAHASNRIVRIGTHTGDGNLQTRLNEHLYTPNKDRSVFRKHIGRCLLLKRGDPFYKFWNLDLTTREAREKHENLIDHARLAEIETEVTAYIVENLTFSAIEVREKRTVIEGKLLSTLAQCPHCGPSQNWLGRAHPNPVVAESGLWNVQGMRGQGLSPAEAALF